MEVISHSLTTFLFNALWQILLVSALAQAAVWCMHKSPSAHKHAVWAAALVVGLLLPLTSVFSLPESTLSESSISAPARPAASDSESAIQLAAPLATAKRPEAAAPAPSPRRTVPVNQGTSFNLQTAYVLFLLVALARLAWMCLGTVRICRTGSVRPLPPAIEGTWRRCLSAFQIRDADILVSPRIVSPITAGVWRRVVIVPESLLSEKSMDVLTAAIGHEIAHVSRRDFTLSLLYELVSLPIVFHPAVWFLHRGLRRTREMACDELVAQRLLEPAVYARSMVTMAADMTRLPRANFTLGVFDGDILEERVRRLLDSRFIDIKQARLLLAASLSSIIVCAFLVSGLALQAQVQRRPPANPQSAPYLLQQAIRIDVEGKEIDQAIAAYRSVLDAPAEDQVYAAYAQFRITQLLQLKGDFMGSTLEMGKFVAEYADYQDLATTYLAEEHSGDVFHNTDRTLRPRRRSLGADEELPPGTFRHEWTGLELKMSDWGKPREGAGTGNGRVLWFDDPVSEGTVAGVWLRPDSVAAADVPARLRGAMQQRVIQKLGLENYRLRPESIRMLTINGQQAITAIADWDSQDGEMSEYLTWIYTPNTRTLFFARNAASDFPSLERRMEQLVGSAVVP